MSPQKFDSIIRTATTSLLSLFLIGALIVRYVTYGEGTLPSYLDLVIVSLASTIVGFYFGGHIASNTAALEEARQLRASQSSEASAVRSEQAAQRAETERKVPGER